MGNNDFVVTHKPINSTTAKVLQPGEHFGGKKLQETIFHSDAPIKTIPFPGSREHDLKGKTFGRLKVIGYLGSNKNNGNHGKWLVKCSCGAYEVRSSPALKQLKSPMCEQCHYLEYIKGNPNNKNDILL